MDIEERAEKWANEYARVAVDCPPYTLWRIAVEAYLAGSAQTQKDYVNHEHGNT